MSSQPHSWKTEVCVSGEWASNALRFATAYEAEAAGRELLTRWTVPTDYRAVPSEDPVNYRMREEYQRPESIASRLEYLRGELEAERISWEELADLQALIPYIERGDLQLLEAAGVPEGDACSS